MVPYEVTCVPYDMCLCPRSFTPNSTFKKLFPSVSLARARARARSLSLFSPLSLSLSVSLVHTLTRTHAQHGSWMRHHNADYGEKEARETALASRVSSAVSVSAKDDSHVKAKEEFMSIAAEQNVVAKDVHRVEREMQKTKNGATNNAALAPSTAILPAVLAPSLKWAQKHQNTLLWAEKLGAKALVGPH